MCEHPSGGPSKRSFKDHLLGPLFPKKGGPALNKH